MLVAQYLRLGGRPLEMAQILNKVDKSELFHISYVIDGIRLVLIEKLTKTTDLSKETDAIEVCSYMLNNHRVCIEKLLASNYATHKKSILRLLTAIVYLAPHLGREILTTFNVAFNVDTLARFTEHDRNECHQSDEDRVRTCYIHFVLAYIIEGNATLIKNVLDCSELVMAIMAGLVYDSQQTVSLLMSSLLKFVLRSESVSKTKKVQIFGTNVVKELLRLFEWKGPEYYAATFNRQLKNKADKCVKMDELANVSAVVYEFLKELLSSRKYGIAFKCLGQRRTKFNAVPKRALLMIEDFWEHQYKASLVIDILRACPELMKTFVQRHASHLDPFKKQSNWSKLIDFFARLIDEMGPDIIQYQIDQMNPKETIDLMKEICMAPEILLQLRSRHTLRNERLTVRHKSTHLLYRMFCQCNRYLYSVAKWDTYRTNELKKIKFELINHILLLCPSVENILLSLHMTQIDETIDSASMFEHLECILDLLLIITKSIPSFIDTSSSVINYIKILGPIYELNREQASSTRIEFKAVKLMLALEPKALSPKTELFDQVLQSFFNVYRFGDAIEQREAKNLLRNVFHNTGLFENGPLEVDLWLEAMCRIDANGMQSLQRFLIQHLNAYDINGTISTQLKPATENCGSSKNITETFRNIENGKTLKGVLDIPMLSPFFQYAIEEYKQLEDDEQDEDDDVIHSEEVLKYLEMVAIHLFHYLPMPDTVHHALDGVEHRFATYMKRWILQSKIGKLPDSIQPEVYKRFYATLTTGDADASFLDVFDCALKTVNDSEENSSELIVTLYDAPYILNEELANETYVMICIYTMVFVATNLHKNGAFTDKKCQQMIKYFKQFVHVLDAITAYNSDSAKFGFEMNNNAINYTVNAMRYIFTNCFYLLQSFDIWTNENQITTLVYELVRQVQHIDELGDILVHYRTKICNQIKVAVANTKESDTVPMAVNVNLTEIMTSLQLNYENCTTILSSVAQLNYNHFVTPQNERSIYANILAQSLHRLTELKEKPLDGSVIAAISTIYVNSVRHIEVEMNYEVIEQALLTYLMQFYHNIGILHCDLFAVLFETKKVTKSTVKLACLLLERQPHLADQFKELLATNVTKKELVYPLINVVADTKWTIDARLLANIYSEYKNGMWKAIEKPHKAAVIYKENVISSVFLIEKCMPLNECVDFLRKTINYESATVFQLQIIKSIHLKILMHSNDIDTIRKAYENFLYIFVQLLHRLLKRDPFEVENVNAFACIAFHWTKSTKKNLLPTSLLPTIKYKCIVGTAEWLLLVRTCLKYGLRLDIDDATKKVNDSTAVLLKLLGYLCDQFYEDAQNEADPLTVFEMVMSHPNMFDIMTQQRKCELKTNFMYLLTILVSKNAEAIDGEHVPILLGAYQAKMSHCDQYILALLQMYERHGVDMHKFKPFMWGESALSHYSLAVATKVKKASLFQEPPMMQVMALIDRDVCENTLVNFPLWRRLNAVGQMPSIDFSWHGIIGDERSHEISVAKNNIEKLVNGSGGVTTAIDENVLLAAAHRDETYDDVYDPAFFVPLMQMAFAPEASTSTVRPAHNGLLATTFAALSSNDKDMRLAAGSAMQRYRTQLENARFADSKLWFHLFDSIQVGLNALTLEARKHKKNRIPRVPYIAGLFFARTLNTLVNPLHEMYRPLSTFLLIKNSFNFLTVPEFNVLFQSPDVNHNAHQAFILDVLRDGMKCSSDFTVLLSGNIFKALLGFYASPMSSRSKNLQILTVVNAAVKIPKASKAMIDLVGIVPWLSGVIDNVEFFQFDLLDILCTIISNLYYSVKSNRGDFTEVSLKEIELRCFDLLLKICPKLSTRIAEVSLVRFLNILTKIADGTQRIHFIGEANLYHLIKCSRGFVSEPLIWDCTFIKETTNAYQYVERRLAHLRKLHELSGLTDSSVFIVSTMRQLTIDWMRATQMQ